MCVCSLWELTQKKRITVEFTSAEHTCLSVCVLLPVVSLTASLFTSTCSHFICMSLSLLFSLVFSRSLVLKCFICVEAEETPLENIKHLNITDTRGYSEVSCLCYT